LKIKKIGINNKYKITVRNINDNKLVKYETNNLYLCTSKTGLINIQFINMNIDPVFKLIKRVSTFREYIVFKKDIDWLKDYDYVMTNLHFHWLIKMNKRSIMMYMDDDLANYLYEIDEKNRIQIYLDNLNYIFGIKLVMDDIETVFGRFWTEAFVVIRTKYFSEYDEIIKNLKDQSITATLIPKNHGIHEAWMETVLLTI
jgi:hypothetical protein